MFSSGNMSPQSTNRIRSSTSRHKQLRPISPNPPKNTMRTTGSLIDPTLPRDAKNDGTSDGAEHRTGKQCTGCGGNERTGRECGMDDQKGNGEPHRGDGTHSDSLPPAQMQLVVARPAA